jgi:hypothetical protein
MTPTKSGRLPRVIYADPLPAYDIIPIADWPAYVESLRLYWDDPDDAGPPDADTVRALLLAWATKDSYYIY